MTHHILTGAPGAGKTSIILALTQMGHATVAEAATDINAQMMAEGTAEPWRAPDFIDRITHLQQQRLSTAMQEAHPHYFHDRSLFCTLALAEYLNLPPSPSLLAECERLMHNATFAHDVFFIEPLGFIENTSIRRISYENTLKFGAVHERVYERYGYNLIRIPPAPVAARIALILEHTKL